MCCANQRRFGQDAGAGDAGQDVERERRGVPGAVNLQKDAAARAFEQVAAFVVKQRVERASGNGGLPDAVEMGAVRAFVAAQRVAVGQRRAVFADEDVAGDGIKRREFDVRVAVAR